MAGTGRVIASIYRYGAYDFPGVTGRTHNFPGNLTKFYPAPSGTTVNGVTMLTVIEQLPSGLQNPQVPSLKFYTAVDVTTLQGTNT